MSIDDNNNDDDVPDVCGNCGKGEDSSGSLKSCTACQMVKYCSRDCQIAHRPQHKKECKKRAAELYDERLFKQPPPEEDCPICFLRMSCLVTGRRYKSCCGKVICSGCSYAPLYDDQGNEVDNQKCSFCRVPTPYTDEEEIERTKKRMNAGDANAVHLVGSYYFKGAEGFPQSHTKTLELWHKAAELGHVTSYYNIACIYDTGNGAELDEKKAAHYYELAAMGGNVYARHNLGVEEANAGKMGRALKHWMIAVRGGHSGSLNHIKDIYSYGHATKDDYTKALQSYQIYLDEIKSDQRDKAAAAYDHYKYY